MPALLERGGEESPGTTARHTGMITVHDLRVWETLEGPKKPGTFFHGVVNHWNDSIMEFAGNRA